ncbi:MAG: alpha/beta hydrolase [Halioglobus sp.]
MTLHTLRISGLIMLAALLTACSNIALKAINTPSYLFSQHDATRNISYGDAAHQKLDLYLPNANIQSKNALVIFVYGGSWTSGQKESYYFIADALTQHGYSVAIPDYLKYPEATFPTFVDDIALATAWLLENGPRYAAQDSVFLMGHSAGAHTGALLITDPSYLEKHHVANSSISGFIGLAGPYGFTPKERKFRDIFANLENFDVMRPQYHISGNEPPVLVLHGEADTTVLPVNSHQFSESINANLGTAHSLFYPDMGHVAILLALSRVADRDNSVLYEVLTFLENTQFSQSITP